MGRLVRLMAVLAAPAAADGALAQQSWQKIAQGHWYTSFMFESYGTVSKTHMNAVQKPHGMAFIVRVECSTDPGLIAVHAYGQGEVVGTLIACNGDVAQSGVALGQWLAAAPAFTAEMKRNLKPLDFTGLTGAPPERLD